MSQQNKERETYHTHYYARPPRIAIFFDSHVRPWEDGWQSYFRRLIRIASENWGGFQFIFVPYNGKSIEDPWLGLLRAYDPDYIARYALREKDFYQENPEEFKKMLEQEFEHQNSINESEFSDYFEAVLDQRDIPASWQNENDTSFFSEQCLSQLEDNVSPFLSPYTDWEEFNNTSPYVSIDSPIIKTGLRSIAWWTCDMPGHKGQVDLPEYDPKNPAFSIWQCSVWGDLNQDRIESTELRETAINRKELVHDCNVEMYKRFFRSWSIPENVYTKRSPFYIGGSDLKERRLPNKIRDPSKEVDLTIVFGSGFMDFCFYYNLSRVRPFVMWIPDEETSKLIEIYSEAVKSVDPIEKLSGHVNLTSIEVNQNEAEERAEKLQCVEKNGDSLVFDFKNVFKEFELHWKPPNELLIPSARRRFITENSFNEHFGPYFDGVSGTPVVPPIPESQKDIPVAKSSWISEYNSIGFQPPSRNTIAKLLADPSEKKHVKKSVDEDDVRISSDGEARSNPLGILHVDIPVKNWISATQLIRPSDEDIFRALLEQSGMKLELSDKGRYGSEAIRIFGGLNNCIEVIGNEDYIKLFDAFNKNGKQDKEEAEDHHRKAGRWVKKDDRYVLSLKSMKEDENGPRLDNAEELVDELVSYGALERGFSLACQRCGRSDWYFVGEVNDTFTCHFCDKNQIYQRKHFNPAPHRGDLNDDPIFFYRLNEMVAQMWEQDGYLPLMTIHKLKNITESLRGAKGFHYHLEFTLDNFGGENEFDFLVSLDGYLILGECKSTEAPKDSVKIKDDDQLGRVIDLSEEIHADFVLFSTNGSKWTEPFKEKVREKLEDKYSQPLFLTKQDFGKEPSTFIDRFKGKLMKI